MRTARWAGALAGMAATGALAWTLVAAPGGAGSGGNAPQPVTPPAGVAGAALDAALEETGRSPGDVAYVAPPQQVICGKNRNEPYSGRFTFVRIFYEERMGRFRGRGEPNWHHDCPYSESNLTSVVGAMTTLTPHVGGNVFSFGDEELFRYPVAYVSEVGFWEPDRREIENLRAWLLKGGFLVFDDFAGYQDIANLARILNAAVPEARLRELDASDAVFRSFFEVDPDSLHLGPSGGRGYGGRERPVYLGLFEDDDPTKRLMVLAFANNDVGEYMDYNPRGFAVVDMNNEAYKLGVNFIIYALTH